MSNRTAESKGKKSLCLGIVNFFNCFQILTWFSTLVTFVGYLVSLKLPQFSQFSDELLKSSIIILKVAQTCQISDIIFASLGCSNNSPFFSFIQVSARLATTYLFIKEDNPTWVLANIMICWSIADTVRPLYYMLKDSKILTWLRYSLFLILYPIGASSECILIEYRINEEIFQNYYHAIRLFQISIMLGMMYLYSFLLKQRRKALGGVKIKEN